VAPGAVDAGLVIVRSQPALREMEADLRSAHRVQPVVGLTSLEEINEPVLAPRLVREIVGVRPRIYYVPGEYLLRRLQVMLGRRLALPAGSARVWWPGMSTRSDPAAHPLVLALDSESQAHMLAELSRVFHLSLPLVCSEIRLIEDARGLAEHELSQARQQNREITIERDQALTRAQQAERALRAATQRLHELDREPRP
jgi:cell division septum initiation protein DivIVA